MAAPQKKKKKKEEEEEEESGKHTSKVCCPKWEVCPSEFLTVSIEESKLHQSRAILPDYQLIPNYGGFPGLFLIETLSRPPAPPQQAHASTISSEGLAAESPP